MAISGQIFRRMRNVLDNCRKENQNTHFMLNNFFIENLIFYELMSKNMAEPDRQRLTMSGMRVLCWISKATIAHLCAHANKKYVILIAFPRKKKMFS